LPPKRDQRPRCGRTRRGAFATATGDRRSALKLLRAHVEGEIDLSRMPVTVGDALVETARGAGLSEVNEGARASVHLAGEARARIIELLNSSGLSTVDLADIRRVLNAIGARARDEEERARPQELDDASTSEEAATRIGSVWLELKYIPDSETGRVYGPYLYGRWRESRHKRSRYIGKA
jgi:hypothetical protein